MEKPAPQEGGSSPDGGDFDWPAPAAAKSDAAELPEIAKKADDLEAIKKAVDDAASVSGALWFSYLFVLFYLAVAAGAVTHADLFLENPVKLPFLGVELPLIAFFVLAPILFLIVHAYVLVHLVLLTDKAKRFHEKLHEQIDDKEIRDGLRRQLPSNIFVQFLAGAPEVRRGAFGGALRAIGWATLVVGPVLLLLLFQLQFLPYHSLFVTWTQRLALAADLLLIWWLWGRILSGRETDGRQRARAHRAWSALGLSLSLGAIFFAGAVATFPGEWPQTLLPSARIFPKLANVSGEASQSKEPSFDDWIASYRDWLVKSEKVSLADWLFNSPIDAATSRRRLPFSNTLVLTGFNIYEGLKIDDPDKLKGRDFVFRARGRDLKGAIFDLAVLPKVDFTGAQLQGARLKGAQLQGASLEKAQLRGASLDNAQLQGASLDGAQLQGASLDGAQLQGASLDGAQLQGASLLHAEIQAASLFNVELQAASLEHAQLQGTSLESAQLQGASLKHADLQGADLRGATLKATDLFGALLCRSNWGGTQVKTAAYSNQSLVSEQTGSLSEDCAACDAKAFERLQQKITSVPPGDRRDAAHGRIAALDCGKRDPALASGGSRPARIQSRALGRSERPNSPRAAWEKRNEYRRVLREVLHTLVCTRDESAVWIVRGHGFQTRLKDSYGNDLLNELMGEYSQKCPVTGLLTAFDRGALSATWEDFEPLDEPP